MKHFTYKIVSTTEEFYETVKGYEEGIVACDVETYLTDPKEGKLLGIGISFIDRMGTQRALYTPIWKYSASGWDGKLAESLYQCVLRWLSERPLVGHNFTYDRKWLPGTTWAADTRLMWHMASAPSGPRPYGLKDAQVEVLGWEARGDVELKANVKANGGDLNKFEFHKADLEVLAKYCCLDVYSTLQLYNKLAPFYDQYDYWWMLADMMAYNILLEQNTTMGVPVDREGLQKAHKRLSSARDGAKKRLDKALKAPILEIEHCWAERRIAMYKREHNKVFYAAHPEKWEKFNWNSDSHKRELFYDKLKNPVLFTTESGKPSTDLESIKQMQGEWTSAYARYEHFNTLISNFANGYLEASEKDGLLHPGFNICGTVSYRLSGFKPYLLNAPFDEKLLMKHLHVPKNYVGVHSDLSAIEPTITAHYSEDPYLLKVFGKGLGDIYLDLALELFPNDKELHEIYNPNIPVTKTIKARLEKQRKIAKVIQLAVQYTGTGTTVSRNLTKAGVQTSVETATNYVRAYWRKFRRIAQWDYQLREVNRREGHLRNVIGRIIRVPDPEYKDLMNRFVQSSAHDCLIKWVLTIDKLAKERHIDMRPMLVDCHDSTSWCVREDQKALAREVFDDALALLNKELQLSVTIKAETKYFRTFAGLKLEE